MLLTTVRESAVNSAASDVVGTPWYSRVGMASDAMLIAPSGPLARSCACREKGGWSAGLDGADGEVGGVGGQPRHLRAEGHRVEVRDLHVPGDRDGHDQARH